SELGPEIGSVMEVVIDGLTDADVAAAMRAGLKAVIELGADSGLKRVGAGNYGGKLGPFLYHLHKLVPGAAA
ncbi:MAG TPA: formylmethanofuran--tetrahydromethanopterin N-formyltransferase, partial [Methylibium sp.]|nr:formylmethanofuran--tetrahydromethanopterin N-formyltransferase [Methylibium sp.]